MDWSQFWTILAQIGIAAAALFVLAAAAVAVYEGIRDRNKD